MIESVGCEVHDHREGNTNATGGGSTGACSMHAGRAVPGPSGLQHIVRTRIGAWK